MASNHLYFETISRFEAARHVEILPENHRSYNLHGHSFLIQARANVSSDKYNFQELHKLTKRLRKCSNKLDYTFLNDLIIMPTDENLVRWFYENMKYDGLFNVGIQSTIDEGADLSLTGDMHIWRRYRFEAAHQLPNVPPGHKCSQMHGHGFEVVLHANQALNEKDQMGFDYDDINSIWTPIYNQLNYKNLNSIIRNPTSENIASWIWHKIKPEFKELSWVTVYETKSCGCHYDGEKYRIWKEQSFESALAILKAPKGEAIHHLHGHSYLIRLHLTSPLDEVLGWTVDYGDVKERFKPIYKKIDHQTLGDIDGLESPDLLTFIYWIKEQLQESLPELDRVDLYETPGNGAILTWGEEPPMLPTRIL